MNTIQHEDIPKEGNHGIVKWADGFFPQLTETARALPDSEASFRVGLAEATGEVGMYWNGYFLRFTNDYRFDVTNPRWKIQLSGQPNTDALQTAIDVASDLGAQLKRMVKVIVPHGVTVLVVKAPENDSCIVMKSYVDLVIDGRVLAMRGGMQSGYASGIIAGSNLRMVSVSGDGEVGFEDKSYELANNSNLHCGGIRLYLEPYSTALRESWGEITVKKITNLLGGNAAYVGISDSTGGVDGVWHGLIDGVEAESVCRDDANEQVTVFAAKGIFSGGVKNCTYAHADGVGRVPKLIEVDGADNFYTGGSTGNGYYDVFSQYSDSFSERVEVINNKSLAENLRLKSPIFYNEMGIVVIASNADVYDNFVEAISVGYCGPEVLNTSRIRRNVTRRLTLDFGYQPSDCETMDNVIVDGLIQVSSYHSIGTIMQNKFVRNVYSNTNEESNSTVLLQFNGNYNNLQSGRISNNYITYTTSRTLIGGVGSMVGVANPSKPLVYIEAPKLLGTP